MALINCPACSRLVSEAAERCIHCGHPIAAAPTSVNITLPAQSVEHHAPPSPVYRGPPHDCRHCGGHLKARREVENGSMGCLLVIIGALLTPVLIGIPIIMLAIHLGTKGKGYWECQRCDARFDRKIKWYQYG